MRMKVLLEADKVVMQLKAEAKLEVAKIAKTPAYKKLLEDLIVEVHLKALGVYRPVVLSGRNCAERFCPVDAGADRVLWCGVSNRR